METYTVTWSTRIDAESPNDAAMQAQAIQRDPESCATCFRVEGELESRIIDTEEIEGTSE